jgi:hypothetical protein
MASGARFSRIGTGLHKQNPGTAWAVPGYCAGRWEHAPTTGYQKSRA